MCLPHVKLFPTILPIQTCKIVRFFFFVSSVATIPRSDNFVVHFGSDNRCQQNLFRDLHFLDLAHGKHQLRCEKSFSFLTAQTRLHISCECVLVELVCKYFRKHKNCMLNEVQQKKKKKASKFKFEIGG